MKMIFRFSSLVLFGLAAAALAAQVPTVPAPPSEPPPRAASPTAEVPTIGLEELQRGQKGYGLSVFSGNQPERFEVEVIGVMRNAQPELSYLLARLSGQDLERSGVIQGMSGSPVYFDGRLAGAVSLGFSYGLDAIAGITPIDAMRDIPAFTGPASPPTRLAGGGELDIDLRQLAAADLDPDLLVRELGRLRPELPDTATSTVQWSAVGFGEAAGSLIRQAVGGRLLSGGSGGPLGGEDDPTLRAPVPGGAVAFGLVQGDLSLAAHGTVTDVDGDELIAFGHPVLSLGPVSAPMAVSEVVTVIPNVLNSFKVSNAGPVIGAFEHDVLAGARGRLGRIARTTPLRVRVRNGAPSTGGEDSFRDTYRDFQMEIAELPRLRPVLFAIGALGALGASQYGGSAAGLDLVMRFGLDDGEEVVLEQSFDGDGAATASAIYLLGLVNQLENAQLSRSRLASLEVDYTQVEHPRTSTLLSVHADRSVVRPGETVPLTLELRAFGGERLRQTVDFEVPEQIGEGKLYVLIGDGASLDVARLTIEQRRPTTYAQSLDLLRSFHSRRQLVTLALIGDRGLSVAGAPLPGLPGSMRAVFAGAASDVGEPLSLAIVGEQAVTLERPLAGASRVDFEVRRAD